MSAEGNRRGTGAQAGAPCRGATARRLRAFLVALVLGCAGVGPARADSEMKQSPLLMRRAGPSCQPGNLGAEPGAGYSYRLGPCAGAEPSDAVPDSRPRRRRGRS